MVGIGKGPLAERRILERKVFTYGNMCVVSISSRFFQVEEALLPCLVPLFSTLNFALGGEKLCNESIL
jgi:hypothetical protein